MKKLLFLSAFLAVAGCKNDQGRADNEATRYAASLQQDTVKAREAAAKATAAVNEDNAHLKEAEQQTQ